MKNFIQAAIVSVCAAWLCGCVPSYSLIKPAPTKVAARAFEVKPTYAWNRAPRAPSDIKQEENWTQNGLALDRIGFIGGLQDGASIVKHDKKAAQRVPAFRSSMGPQDLVSMIESYYRIRGVSIFETISIKPVKFVGESGVQFDYQFVASDEVKRCGRAVMAISAGKLYVMNLSAAAVHYFDKALPEFETLTASARVPSQKGCCS
jgi:hypothetical protein